MHWRLRTAAMFVAMTGILVVLGSVIGKLLGNWTMGLLAMLAGRNLTLTRKIGHMARRSIRDKLLSYLSAQAIQAGGPEFDIPLDRQQLADYLAVDRSALSAALGKLRDEGVLTFRKNHFRLLRKLEHTD